MYLAPSFNCFAKVVLNVLGACKSTTFGTAVTKTETLLTLLYSAMIMRNSTITISEYEQQCDNVNSGNSFRLFKGKKY